MTKRFLPLQSQNEGTKNKKPEAISGLQNKKDWPWQHGK
jgi:hypothetical protein